MYKKPRCTYKVVVCFIKLLLFTVFVAVAVVVA